MAIEWKSNRTWQSVRNRQPEMLVDGAGVEWDMDYVVRFDRLQSSLRGKVIATWHADYEDTRHAWLGTVQRWPAAMVICREDADIEICCAFAAKFNLSVSLRMRGHVINEEAVEDGALLIDMSLVV